MILYVDGFVDGFNPSPKGGGFTICDSTGKCLSREYRGRPGMTNNETELLAALNALILCKPGDSIVTDSQNTLNWIGNPRGNKARRDLKDLCRAANALVAAKNVALSWCPREQNLAGRLNEILGSGPNISEQTLI
jgi:ribonuclease HI